METLWFFLIAATFATYATLDGFDFGVGILHLYVARTSEERGQTLRSIGPVWDGNEVWLVAAGASLLCAFPKLFAATFSGFYLPLMVVLWLLIFRGLGIEFRHQARHPLWRQLWDVAFSVASSLLALCFGAALGNVIRGVPLTSEGTFFLPLWTDLGVGEPSGVLDWYTLLVGAFAMAITALQGALWLADRTDREVRRRAVKALPALYGTSALLLAATSVATFVVRDAVLVRLTTTPLGLLIVIAMAGFFGSSFWRARGERFRAAFWLTSAASLSLIVGAAYGLYPHVLPALEPGYEIELRGFAASTETLRGTLYWWLPGMALAVAYTTINYRKMPSLFSVEDDEH